MNKRTDREAKLLAELFHGDWNSGEPAAFARFAAAHARRQRLTRQTLVAATAAAIITLCFFPTWWQRSLPPSGADATASVSASTSTIPARGYEIISDDELLEQLKDQALLVVEGENGSREFVLLEGGRPDISSD